MHGPSSSANVSPFFRVLVCERRPARSLFFLFFSLLWRNETGHGQRLVLFPLLSHNRGGIKAPNPEPACFPLPSRLGEHRFYPPNNHNIIPGS